MRQIVPVLLGIAAAIPLFAGKRIEMQSTDLVNNKVTPNSILLDADRMRVDQGNTSVMFLTKGGNHVVILDKARNEYRELTQADIEQLGQQLNSAMSQLNEMMKNVPPAQRAQMEAMLKGRMGAAAPGVAAAAATTYTAKGGATVNGFKCTNYEGTREGQKVAELCAAQPGDLKIAPTDFQVMEKMRDMFSGLVSSVQNSPFANMNLATAITDKGINGFPVQATTFSNGQAKSREELKSVSDATFSDADFSTGSAKKVDLGLPGRAKGK